MKIIVILRDFTFCILFFVIGKVQVSCNNLNSRTFGRK